MGESFYIAERQDKIFCPKCGKPIHKLHDPERWAGCPEFMICFDCKFIAQASVGEVEITDIPKR